MNKAEHREFKDLIFEQFARIGKALSHPKRLEILDLLAQTERTVEQIAQETAMPVANTSQHLQVLKGRGWWRRVGRVSTSTTGWPTRGCFGLGGLCVTWERPA